jgi:HEAT repeat protein
MSPLRKSLAPAAGEVPEQHRRVVEHTLDTLLAALVDDDPERRRRAVLDLADRLDALPALVAQFGVESNLVVRDALCTQLARYDLPEVVDGLIDHLSSDDAGLRNAVVHVLSKTQTATARRLPALLVDPDPDVRILTVTILSSLRLPEVEDWLTDVVTNDPSPNVVSAAIGELASLTGARCEQLLCEARDRFPTDPFITFSVTRTLTALDREQT